VVILKTHFFVEIFQKRNHSFLIFLTQDKSQKKRLLTKSKNCQTLVCKAIVWDQRRFNKKSYLDKDLMKRIKPLKGELETKEQAVNVDLFFFLMAMNVGLFIIGLWCWKNGWCCSNVF
jgi:alpha-N-acetylglucosamine transferase